jgi:anti-anti-sigma factor
MCDGQIRGVYAVGVDPHDAPSFDSNELTLATEVEAHIITITVRGELDAVSAMTLNACVTRALTEAAGRRILIDLEQVEHFGSAGIAILVQAHRRAHEQGVPFRVITGDNTIVTRPLAAMKLDNVLRLYSTRATALA